MNIEEVKQKIAAQIPDANIEVVALGNGFDIIVKSAIFAELSELKRQQKVLGCLADAIAQGEIHAVTVKTYVND